MRARNRTGQSSKEATSIPLFFDEDMVSIPPERILDEFRRLSRFLPVIVLIPKSAICENTAKKRFNIDQIRVGHQRCSAFSLACEGSGVARTPERGRPLCIWRSYGKFFGDGNPTKGAVNCPHTQRI